MSEITEALKKLAEQVRDERKAGANTAERVGSLLVSIIGAIQEPHNIPDLTGYATQTWVQDQKYLTEHQDLTIYKQHIEDESKHLSAEQIELINKISGKLDKSEFDELFEKKTENGVTYIHAKFNLYSDYDITAGGIGGNATSGSSSATISYNRLDQWADYSSEKAGYVLSALLGYDLHTRLTTIEGDYATQAWVTSQKYLTAHQSIYALTIQGNGTALGTYTPNSAAKTINITYSNVGAAAASHSHTIAQITNLQTSLDAKLNKSVFDELFEKVTENGVTYIHAKFNLYSDYDITAGGIGGNATSGSSSATISYNRLDKWADYTSEKAGYVLSALLGYDLHTRLTTIEGDYATQAWVTSQKYLTTHQDLSAYATQTWVQNQKYLTAHQSIYALTIQGNGTALGTYTPNSAAKTINITYSNVGAAAASHSHTIAQITNLQTSLDAKLNKSVFDELFEKVTENGVTYIHAKYNFYSDYNITAGGIGSDATSGSSSAAISYNRLDQWADYTSEKAGYVLSALLGYDLHTRLTTIEGDYATQAWVTSQKYLTTHQDLSAYATQTWVQTQKYLTAHQSIYALTIQGNGTALGTFTPNSAAKTINITYSNVGAAAATHTHTKSQITDFPATWAWSALTGVPTTLSGYGITDAYTKTQVDTIAAKYLLLDGTSFFNSEKYPKFYSSRISSTGGGWAMHQLVMYAADKTTEVYRLGIYGGNETLSYIFLGTGTYGASNNLRIYPSGTVSATTFSGALSGNASTATKLATARTIALTGAVTGSGTFDGSGNLSIATTNTATTLSGYGITDAYTKTEVDTLAAKYLPLTGGTVTGATTFSGTVALNGTTTAKGITSSGVFKSTYSQALFGYVSSGWTYIRLQSGSTYFWDIATSSANYSNALQFRYKGSATSTNGMQLTIGGNLGIGCVAPTYKLQVAGTLYASGAATFASTLKIGSATLSWDEETQSLKVDKNFYSEGEVTAGGPTVDSGTTGGTAGISYDRLDAWTDYTTAKSGYVLSALLGYDLHTRLTTVESGYATQSWVTSQGYLTSYVNTTYTAGTGLSLSGTTFSNAGVRSIATGTANGTISVNTNGTTANVSVYGLGTAAYTASTAYAAASHTHSYAGSASAGGAAKSVANALVLKIKTGTTEGTDLYTYNGSAAKTLDIVAGSNITLTAASGKLTIASSYVNTTYSAGTGLSLSGTTFSNAGVRSIATGTANGTISVNTNGTTANVSVYGLGSAAYTASTAYAAASHTHSYLPLSGGTLTGALTGTTITATTFSGALSGNATTATALRNYYSSRPTSMNVQFSDGNLRTFLATSSCTTGKPTLGDAHIIHLAWDNSGGWDSEIAVGLDGSSNTQFMQYRHQLSGTWKDWATLLDSTNYASYAAKAVTWTATTTVNSWSRICKINSYTNTILTINFSQNNQAAQYSFLINTSHGCGMIYQIGYNGSWTSNVSGIQVRLTMNTGNSNNEYYIEVINTYGYNSATTVQFACRATTLDHQSIVTPYTAYTAGGNTVKYTCGPAYNYAGAFRAEFACKLLTARNLWGNSWNGSGDLTGAITVAGESHFYYSSYTDPWSGTSCAIKASGNVAVGGALYSTGEVTAGSDIRHKSVIEYLPEIAPERISAAPIFKFKWTDRDDDKIHIGTSAQYWQEILPEIVTGTDFLTLNYPVLATILAVQASRRIDRIEQRILAIEQENRELKQEISQLKNA